MEQKQELHLLSSLSTHTHKRSTTSRISPFPIASILENLRRRFEHLQPYTYTGDICIAINPYQWLDIYSDELRESHEEKYRHELPPHVYSTSASAFRGLRDFNHNQSILVSGESGAGKTETVKILMKHLAHISGKKNNKTITKVLEANPLLESFGNAKTSRNDNSSRFGKFTQLQFDRFAKLTGSRCVTYLLEKSRVVIQNDQERNYHIFYQLFAAPEHIKSKLNLSSRTARDFAYTRCVISFFSSFLIIFPSPPNTHAKPYSFHSFSRRNSPNKKIIAPTLAKLVMETLRQT